MTQPKPVCASLRPFLTANLGRHALGALTGTDSKALAAAVHIIELYAYDRDDSVLSAFHDVVLRMQPSTRRLAYEAVAHVMDWPDRDRVWQRAGLAPIEGRSV